MLPLSILCFWLLWPNVCVLSPNSLGRAFYSTAGNFKDVNAFSVSLAKWECFSSGNFPFEKNRFTDIPRSVIFNKSCLKKKGEGRENRNATNTG